MLCSYLFAFCITSSHFFCLRLSNPIPIPTTTTTLLFISIAIWSSVLQSCSPYLSPVSLFPIVNLYFPSTSFTPSTLLCNPPPNTIVKMATYYPVLSVSISIAAIATLISLLLNLYESHNPPSLLQELAAHQFAWGKSTTDVPISTVSVIAKRLLSRDPTLPHDLLATVAPSDTISIQPIRDYTNAQRLVRIKTFCARHVCDVSETDPNYKLTPLHLAAFSGDHALSKYLIEHGAEPRSDHVGRLPHNLTFASFIPNSKRFAREAGRHCEFPVVEFDGSEHAKAETTRLVSEGEPVLLRGAFRHYAPQIAEWQVNDMVQRFSHMRVTVGHVPYAAAFNLSTREMSLGEFYERFVQPEAEGREKPLYVFNKGAALCVDGYRALVSLVEEAFPAEILEHPDATGALDGIHFFFGKKSTGAPFHIHADAVNAAVHGAKRWFVFTPAKTVYSRKTIKEWVEEDLPTLGEDKRPLECLQEAGDVVYVPLDWGHAVLNEEDNTFGYALELLNRRDTFAHLWR